MKTTLTRRVTRTALLPPPLRRRPLAVDRLTGITYRLGGNYQFQVDVADNTEQKSHFASADTIAIRVWDATGTFFMSGNAGGNSQVVGK